MANALKIALILTAVDKASAITDKAFKKMNANLKGLDKSKAFFNKYGNYAMGAGAVVTAAFIPMLKAAADIEKMQVSLTTSFQGNKKAADDAFKSINKFASTTPYEVGEVMTAFIKLKNMGLDPSEKALTAYGNTASSMGKDLNMMIEAVADAATFEFERLKEFGIKVKQQKDTVSFLFQGTTTTVKKNAKAIEDYLQKIGLTKFAGGIEAQSKTIYGQLSTLKDGLIMFAASIGKIFIPILNNIFKKVTPIIEKIQAWADKHPVLIKWIGILSVGLLGLGVAMKVIAFGIGGIQMAGKALGVVSKILMANPIILIIAAIAAAAYLIYEYWDEIVAYFTGLWDKVKDIFGAVWTWIKKIFWDNNPAVLIYKNWGKIVQWFKSLWQKVKETFMAFIKYLGELPGMLWKKGVDFITAVWNGMKQTWPLVKAWFKSALVSLYSPNQGAMIMIDALKEYQKNNQIKINATNPAGKKPAGIGAGSSSPTSYNPTSKNSASFQFNPVYNLNGTATQADAAMINATTQKGFEKMMQQYENNKQRTAYS